MQRNELTREIIGAGIKVHRELGPGLLEKAYEACLEYELNKSEIEVKRQMTLPVVYDGKAIDAEFRIDLLVENRVVVEVKSVKQLASVHEAQLMTYMKLAKKDTGLLLNFNVSVLKNGIKRIVM